MAKQKKIARLTSPPTAHARGRTAKTNHPDTSTPVPTEGRVAQERITEAARPMGAGGGGSKRRGDRRDTSRLYTNNTKHSARGNTPRADVKTRKR
jgi:hypothetical protein